MKFASNAPEDYVCPICLGLQGSDSEKTLLKETDIVYKDELVTGFINSFFMGNNPGHVILVTNEHFENIFDIPNEYSHRVIEVSVKVAAAMKQAYNCDGITTRQNNEPAGDQHAFHYHFHVFPRYKDDGFNKVLPSEKRLAPPEERAEYAQKLAAKLENSNS
jgi:histidine triad (HIT) family protein